jgi:hypothetical protein
MGKNKVTKTTQNETAIVEPKLQKIQRARMPSNIVREIADERAPQKYLDALSEAGIPMVGDTVQDAIYAKQVEQALDGDEFSTKFVDEKLEPKGTNLKILEEKIQYDVDGEKQVATIVRRQLTLSVGSKIRDEVDDQVAD